MKHAQEANTPVDFTLLRSGLRELTHLVRVCVCVCMWPFVPLCDSPEWRFHHHALEGSVTTLTAWHWAALCVYEFSIVLSWTEVDDWWPRLARKCLSLSTLLNEKCARENKEANQITEALTIQPRPSRHLKHRQKKKKKKLFSISREKYFS